MSDLTLFENVAVAGYLGGSSGEDAQARAAELLEQMHVDDARNRLPGPERKRSLAAWGKPIRSQGSVTRAQAAVILYRYLNQEVPDTPEGSIPRETDQMYVQVGDAVLTVTLAGDPSAGALREPLKKGPLTIDMSDCGNFEKVGSLGTTLPRNVEQITTSAGDIILYQGNQITIYYAQNSWDFTRLGTIDHITAQQLKEILGAGDVSVTFWGLRGARLC